MRVAVYLLRVCGVRFAAALGAAVVIYAAIDSVEMGGSAAAGGLLGTLQATAQKTPLMVTQLAPLALALAVALSISSLRGRGELDALSASGIRPLFVAGALLVLPAGFAPISWVLSSFAAPRCLPRVRSPVPSDLRSSTWLMAGSRVALVDSEGAAVVLDRDARGAPSALAVRGNASAASTCWSRTSGFGAQCASGDLKVAVDASRSGGLGRLIDPLSTAGLTNAELEERALLARRLGMPALAYDAEKGLRVALALACLLVPLVALVFALRTDEARPTLLVALAMLGAALYSVVLVFTWNAALCGAVSASVCAIGAPVTALVLAGALALPRLRAWV